MAESNKISFQNTEIAFATKSNSKLKKAYWLFYSMKFTRLASFGMKLISFSFKIGLPIKWIIKVTIFEHFCGGENVDDCESAITDLGNANIGTILDYSVEGEETNAAFDNTTQETIKTIKKANSDKNIPFSVFKMTGVAAFELLHKVQEDKGLDEIEKENFDKVKERVNLICKTAFELKVPLFIDAEETWIQNTVDDLVHSMMELYNKEQAIVHNTIQFYRKDGVVNLKKSYQKSVEGNYFYGIKMVRGAYMEQERERAEENNYPSPIHDDKHGSDECFDDGLRFCLDNHEKISLCAGTHNEESNLLLTHLISKKGLQKNHPTVYFAQLYGMSDHISFNLSAGGYNVAKYVPYGPVKSVMPYLFRRAEENTSIAGQTGRELLLIEAELKRRKG